MTSESEKSSQERLARVEKELFQIKAFLIVLLILSLIAFFGPPNLVEKIRVVGFSVGIFLAILYLALVLIEKLLNWRIRSARDRTEMDFVKKMDTESPSEKP